MLNRVLYSKLLKTKSSLGVEIILKTSDEFTMNLVELSQKKGSIYINNIREGLTSLDQLKKIIKYNTPVVLAIRGKGVLSKIIEIEADKSPLQMIGKILPNASEKDFCAQVTPSDPEHHFVSVIRRDILSVIIKRFTDQKIFPYDLSLGYSLIANLASLINIPSSLFIDDENIILRDGKISGIKKYTEQREPELFHVGDQDISSNLINSYAAGFSYFFPTVESISIDSSLDDLRREYLYKNLFQKAGIALVGFFFILLMINYIIFNHYSIKVSQASAALQQYDGLMAQTDSLKKNLEFKQALVQESGFLHSYQFCYLADRIAFSRPSGILFYRLNIQPSSENQSEDEKYNFRLNTIEISGKANNSFIINDWVNRLKGEKWAKEVSILDYKNDSRENNGKFIIGIEIK